MYKVFTDFDHYKNNVLQELIHENYYLSKKDAEEHILIYQQQLFQMYLQKIPISKATDFFITYSYTLK